MDSPHFFGQDGPTVASKYPCLLSLFERALCCAQQGLYRDSVVSLRLLREQLSPDQSSLISTLDTFMQCYDNYWQAQQGLQQASKRFVEADRAQQAQTDALEKLLPVLKEDKCIFVPEFADQVQKPGLHSSPSQNILHSPPSPSSQVALIDKHELPALSITCFGHFTVKQLHRAITLCTNRSGQTIMRYLMAQPDHSATIDKLIHALWPGDEMDIALHKLRIAASALRRSLNDGYDCDSGGGYLLCRNRVYQLNPTVLLQSDVDDFIKLYRTGLKAEENEMISSYEKACQLYTGPFLSEDLYADWSFFLREQLSQTYLTMCGTLSSHYLHTHHYENVVKWATAILKENKCDEAAYQQLMRAYADEGCRAKALRQYQRCQQVLHEELGIAPMPETVELFQMIQQGTLSSQKITKIELF